MTMRIHNYGLFFRYYLEEHRLPLTRAWHYLGTSMVLVAWGVAALTQAWWLLPMSLVFGYGPAWIGHFFVEHNRPATFQYPLWSLISDFRMYGLWVSGRLDRWLD